MAGGNNSKFMKDPVGFLRTHQLMISPQGIGSQALAAGQMNIDIVSIDPKNPQFVRLENYNQRKHSMGSRPVKAYYLPAIFDNTSTLDVALAADYIFTADLSGCLFAAYGQSANALTVEHVNVRTPNAAVPIQPRAQAIIQANHPFYKILAPAIVPNADAAHVKVYQMNSAAMGVKTGAGWTFYYKPTMTSALPL